MSGKGGEFCPPREVGPDPRNTSLMHVNLLVSRGGSSGRVWSKGVMESEQDTRKQSLALWYGLESENGR